MNMSFRYLQICFLITFVIGFSSGGIIKDFNQGIGKVISGVGGGIGDAFQGNFAEGLNSAAKGFASALGFGGDGDNGGEGDNTGARFLKAINDGIGKVIEGVGGGVGDAFQGNFKSGVNTAVKGFVSAFKKGVQDLAGKNGNDNGGNDNGGNDNGGNDNGGADNGNDKKTVNAVQTFENKVTNFIANKGDKTRGNDNDTETGNNDTEAGKNNDPKDKNKGEIQEIFKGLFKGGKVAIKDIFGDLKNGQLPNLKTDVDSGIDTFFNALDSKSKKEAANIIVGALMKIIKLNGEIHNEDPIVALADLAKKLKNKEPILPDKFPLSGILNKLIEIFGNDILDIIVHLLKKSEGVRGKNLIVDFAENVGQKSNLLEEGAAILPVIF